MSDPTSDKPGGSQPVVVKKYANRRLYNTATSSYVTLDDLARMIKEGGDFVVKDAKTGEDLTRSVLTQIIVEQEQKGQNLLPISFLRQLIGFYGDNMQFLVPGYLEQAMKAFARNQEQMRSNLRTTFGMFPFGQFEEIGKQNMAMFERALRMLSPAALETSDPADAAAKRRSRAAEGRVGGPAAAPAGSADRGPATAARSVGPRPRRRLKGRVACARSGYGGPTHWPGALLSGAPISPGMTIFLTILLVLAMLATLGVLGMGVVQMIRGGDPRRSNRLMQSRVAFQGLALLLLALLMMLIGRS